MKRLIYLLPLFFCALALSLGQYDATGSINTTGTTVVMATVTGAAQIHGLTLVNDDSTENLLVCPNATDVSANCTFKVKPGESYVLSGQDAKECIKIHFEADANTTDYRLLITY